MHLMTYSFTWIRLLDISTNTEHWRIRSVLIKSVFLESNSHSYISDRSVHISLKYSRFKLLQNVLLLLKTRLSKNNKSRNFFIEQVFSTDWEVVGSNSTEMMTNQFQNWFKHLDIYQNFLRLNKCVGLFKTGKFVQWEAHFDKTRSIR